MRIVGNGPYNGRNGVKHRAVFAEGEKEEEEKDWKKQYFHIF
jgi:hypothetical protein